MNVHLCLDLEGVCEYVQFNFLTLKATWFQVPPLSLVLNMLVLTCRKVNMLLSPIDGRSLVMCILMRKCWIFLPTMLTSFWSTVLMLKGKSKF